MNVIEFLGRNEKDSCYMDLQGNLRMDSTASDWNQLPEIMDCDCFIVYVLSKEKYDLWSQYQVLIGAREESFTRVAQTRRPYYRMRGRRVTEEQAFDMIRRTDNFSG
ncbi:MAG TPA: hypothetical protein IAB31_05790 [Candidatus Choladousia intestinavium]|uniref:Uncharacterized protein n=1 Tax=Candidatus Choladousia intestinavium TaxID=2840727 RepID=A0A9D1ABW8_9FIRM|nr:hypothetical protein [Candidatus Choladousia intestinavium]